MSHCYSYTPKGATEPEYLNVLDEKIAEHLGVPVHPKRWVADWDNYISLWISLGWSFDQIRTRIAELRVEEPECEEHLDALLKITNFLDENYVAHAWREMGFARR